LLAICAALPASAAMHATQEFEAGTTRPVTIAFLPPHALLVMRKIVQSEQQLDESAAFAAHLSTSLEEEFSKRGYEVKMLTPEVVNADPALQELVLDADRRYSEMLTQVRTKLPRQIGKRRYEAGDELRLLAAKLGVDAIGFADLQVVSSAAGASAVAIIVGFGAAGTQALLSVSLIDGRTSNIEAYFVPPVLRRGTTAGYDTIMSNPGAVIASLTQATLRDLPPADASARAPASPEQSDNVLSDIEDLLEK
jgi:hypothetical protein